MALLGDYLVAAVVQAAGFRGPAARNAVAVALAESRGDPTAIGDVDNPKPGARSIGLFQINTHYHPNYDPKLLTDPLYNARAAYAISNAGASWRQWTTWPKPASDFLERADKALASAPADSRIVTELAKYQTAAEMPAVDRDTLNFHIDTPFGDVTSESGLTGLAADAANAALDPMAALASIARALLNPRTWLRVLFIVAGGVLLVSAARLIIADTTGS